MAEPTPDLALAAQRLEKAVAALEGRMRAVKARSGRGEGDLFDQDRARLADDLDQARARQTALESAATEASQALGRAIAEVSALLQSEA